MGRIKYLVIDGVEMPAPSTYTIKRSDVNGGDALISEAGFQKVDRIRGGVYTIVCDWNLREPQLQTLCNALSKETFEANVYDGTTGDYITITAKASEERSATLVMSYDNPSRNLWSFACDIKEL